ncbi:MAG: glycosyl hydrolase family 65 protein [Chlamydiales bacterium]
MGWSLVYDKFEPQNEKLRESLCTLGNGYFIQRGAQEWANADEIHYPGTYLAGGYNRLKTEIEGRVIESEDLVNFPNCLPLNFRIGEGPWFDMKEVKIYSYEQKLDLREGVLSRKIHFCNEKKQETRLFIRRFVSMHRANLAAIEMLIQPLNWRENIEVMFALDGRVDNSGVARYKQLNNKHLEPVEARAFNEKAIYLQVRTNQSHIHMAQAARMNIHIDGQSLREFTQEIVQEEGYIAKVIKFHVGKAQTIRLEKIISLYTSRDFAISECGLEARRSVMRLGSFDQLLELHKLAWIHLWRRFDIDIEVDEQEQSTLPLIRLHIFHMLQTISMHSRDRDVGIPSRGWHGEAYRGHILWDELFVFSTFNLQIPELTRALLLYRYRRLPAAKRAARNAQLKGAMYPWQSGSSGREESQAIHLNPISGRWIPDNSYLQRHVNAAIVYNVWQHFEATEDLEFLSFYGAEIILEIARFWASLTTYNYELNRYEILNVMGPDEYHDGYPDSKLLGINNNAYTNVIVSWVFSRALRALEIISKDRRRELEEMIQLKQQELHRWDEIRKNLYIPFHADGVISQFEGYENLKELDWENYRKKYRNIQRLDRILESEGDSPNSYKVSKQADVLMLFYLFSAEELRLIFEDMGYELKKETIEKTVDYYLNRTCHGSTLSNFIHSWVFARRDRQTSWNFFSEALKSDVADVQGGTTAEGIHLGAMAGTVDLLQRCYLGIEYRGDVLHFNPCLPDELKRMETEIRYRGHSLVIEITHKKLCVRSERASAKPIQIAYIEKLYPLKEGERKEFEI